ncbi:unnamed protein product [Lasius platythorax]|uniref:Uncharacterized protein n=1 Tax=Lasius platythorax TaxID=488582 RepID=A0AAV2NJ92_9HYME
MAPRFRPVETNFCRVLGDLKTQSSSGRTSSGRIPQRVVTSQCSDMPEVIEKHGMYRVRFTPVLYILHSHVRTKES